MGKAQSKRSVDITTEVKDANAVDDGTGKVAKIEEIDQLKPQLNGDANHKDAEVTDKEKKVEKDEAENEKDQAQEKSEPIVNGEGDGEGDAAIKVAEKNEVNKSIEVVENGSDEHNESTDATLDESKVSELAENGEADASATPSEKKPKKEKTKKRWSFRSFSFSKKDKQKPAKKGADDAAAVTNGECEKVPEEIIEEGAVATEKTVDSPTEEKKSEDASAQNGEAAPAAEEPKAAEAVAVKIEAAAPIASPEASVDPVVAEKVEEAPAAPEPVAEEAKPAAEEPKPVEQTLEEAIIEVTKNVEIEKVAKPEVNDEPAQQPNTQIIQEQLPVESAPAVDSTVPNNTETSAGLGDNSTNNNPPPLPDCPPPSQVSVFAVSALSSDDATLLPAPSHPLPCPVIPTNVQSKSDSVLVGSTKLEVICAAATVVDEVIADAERKLSIDAVEAVEPAVVVVVAEPENVAEVAEVKSESPKAEEIAETIAILDSATEQSSAEKQLPAPPAEEAVVSQSENTDEQITEPIKDDLSADISSPLPQNSIESLPSPQLSTSEVEETTEPIPAEDTLPPPPPVEEIDVSETQSKDDESTPLEKSIIEDESIKSITEESLPPPPVAISESESIVSDATPDAPIVQEAVKTNGQHAENAVVDVPPPATNGGSETESVSAAKSDKENGVADSPVKENGKLNGDHKTIEEIVPSPEKLEKLAALNTSTEVATAE